MTTCVTALEVRGLVKRYAPSQPPAVDCVSFGVERAEILALVGPSGCGKTTTLRLIAGLERPDSGVIRIADRAVASDGVFTPPERRGVGMVFQDHALFPHLTSYENVAFGLRGRKGKHARERALSMLRLVGLERLANRHPHELSGGERQRVALARALAPEPAVILMDEPFSSLDADMRLDVREQVREIVKAMAATVVFVTHDQDEALFMGDRLAVFDSGRLEQIGTPEEIFHGSATRFVAEFMGDSDFLAGQVVPGGTATALGLARTGVPLPRGLAVEVALRADDVDFQPDPAGNALISRRIFRGAFNLYRLRLDSGEIAHAYKEHTENLPVGLRVRARISATHPLAVFEAKRPGL
jgi:iron(III) transport system ATP-binding protein